MTISTKKLEAALIVVAKFFDEPIKNQEGETVNRLAYVQARILNSICYGAAQSLERTKGTTLPKAQDEVRMAMKSHRGDELSEVTLNKKIDWLDRVNDQIAHLEALDLTAREVYANATGEQFIFGTRKASTGTQSTDGLSRAQASLDATEKHTQWRQAPATDYQSPDADMKGRDAA